MPLEILGPLVFSGILLAVLFVRFFADTPARLIVDDATARALLLRDYPEVEIAAKVIITNNKTEALLALENPIDCFGLVHVMGSKHVTRLLSASDVESISIINEMTLLLRLNELTLPKITLEFSSTDQKESATKFLSSMVKQ